MLTLEGWSLGAIEDWWTRTVTIDRPAADGPAALFASRDACGFFVD
jgi:hypothetical protein